jgi:hypothetical protein
MINVMESSNDSPFRTLLHFQATMTMNYLSADRLVCLYPKLTLNGTGVSYRNRKHIYKWVLRYISCGYVIILQPCHMGRCGPYICPYLTRFDGDAYCLTININHICGTDDMKDVIANGSISFGSKWHFRS